MKDTQTSGVIYHEGIVQKNDNNSVSVSIIASTACSGCHAGSSCNMSGKEEKLIEISGKYDVSQGDRVTILMKQSMGFAALFLGYLLPLLSVLTLLIVLISMKVPELISGLVSLSILIPYYIILFLFRKRVDQKFTFTLKV